MLYGVAGYLCHVVNDERGWQWPLGGLVVVCVLGWISYRVQRHLERRRSS